MILCYIIIYFSTSEVFGMQGKVRVLKVAVISCILLLILTIRPTLWISNKIKAQTLLDTCISTELRSPLPTRIGAYYQTSLAHTHATEVVLTIFRRSYDQSPLFVYIDEMQPSQTFEWYRYQPIQIMPGPLSSNLRSADRYGTYFDNVDACMAYVNRIITASRNLDWLILLEDDVWVCNSVDTSALIYDMNGQCLAQYNPSVWSHMTPGPCYGGYGGFVLRASFLQTMKVEPHYIHSMLAHIKRPIASDELLSALFLRSHGTIGKIMDYSEKITSIASPVIVHQMKQFYS